MLMKPSVNSRFVFWSVASCTRTAPERLSAAWALSSISGHMSHPHSCYTIETLSTETLLQQKQKAGGEAGRLLVSIPPGLSSVTRVNVLKYCTIVPEYLDFMIYFEVNTVLHLCIYFIDIKIYNVKLLNRKLNKVTKYKMSKITIFKCCYNI